MITITSRGLPWGHSPRIPQAEQPSNPEEVLRRGIPERLSRGSDSFADCVGESLSLESGRVGVVEHRHMRGAINVSESQSRYALGDFPTGNCSTKQVAGIRLRSNRLSLPPPSVLIARMTPIQKATSDSAAALLAPASGYHRGGRHSRRRSHVHSYVAVPVLERFELGAAGDRIRFFRKPMPRQRISSHKTRHG